MTNTTQTTMARNSLLLAVAGLLVALAPRAGALDPAKAEPEVVARVNGDPATREELERARRQLQLELGSPTADPELDRAALRKLIQMHLLLQEAGRRKLVVTEKDLDGAVSALRGRFDDLAGLGAWMKARGLDDASLFDHLRAELLAARVRAALAKDVRIDDEQVRRYHEAHAGDLRADGDVRLRIIAAQDRKVAEEVMAALRKGEGFTALARARSRGKRASRGGDTGWLDPRRLPSPLREAVAGLKVGDAAGPLRRGDEFLVVALAGRRTRRAASLAEARPEIERRLIAAKREEAVRVWLAEQERQSSVEILAKAR